jgi:YegS/Rv2252/BmrU family lipid kinase
MQKSAWSVELVETKQPGDATKYAKEAGQVGLDMILVAGGDGTINEAVNGVVGTSTAIGLVPVGTGNILAHQLRMPILSLVAPLKVMEMGQALLNSRIQRVDVGVVSRTNGVRERYFVCWAGVGLDAEIAAQMEPRSRYAKRLRLLPYLIAAFSVAAEFKGVRAQILVEDHAINTRALLALASNIQLYASIFNIAPQARMDDGLLDIFVFKGLGFQYALRHLLFIFSGRYLRDPRVVYALARQIQMETSPEVAVHLDGEPFGETPTLIHLKAGVLRLVVPPQAPHELFSRPPEQVV